MKKALISILFVCLTLSLLILGVSADGTSPTIVSLKIESYPTRTVYGAFDSFDPTGLVVSAVMEDGSRRNIPTADLIYSYHQDGCFRVGDEYITISYGGRSVHLPVTVNRISYSLDAKISDLTLTYNGDYQSYNQALPIIVGLDGIPLGVKAVGGGTNVGEYEVFIEFSTESKDYLTPESAVASLKIQPLEVAVNWSNLSFVYDGKSKAPSATFTAARGVTQSLAVLGSATNAGIYTARVSASDPNYIFTETSIDYEIRKADYDMSGVSWRGTSFVYDGSKRSVTLNNLPKGVSVIGYEGDVASDAGKYTATATLAWDTANYNAPSLAPHNWEILPAEYDLTGFKFIPSTFVYDGQMHYPTMEGNMPVGADGIKLEYSFSAGATHVSDGKVSVIISFSTASGNYKIPSDQYSSVSITPRGINVTWSSDTLYYTGERQSPTATSPECNIKVSGGALTVGKYTATAESKNSDYYILNDRFEFRVLKAQNSWRVTPTSSTCYEGREIKLAGESRFGEVKYSFYSDKDGINKIATPTAVGVYYARLVVEDTMNYSGLTSDLIRLEIVEIAPISFIAKLGDDKLIAFGKVSTDLLTCSVINNDGSTESVASSEVKILYQNGDSLKKSDTFITVIYDKFSLTLPISVDYATYDLSGVSWENITTTYNGEPQLPSLVNLPEGVKVVSYSDFEMINAGVYNVTAELSYDSENYHKPIIAACRFTIEKKPIPIPSITAVYNGKNQVPISDSLLYSIDSFDGYSDVGIYPMAVSLTDSRNYIFAETGQTSANGLFRITPATLSVKIQDLKLHLFEKIKGADYFITSGKVYGDDYVPLSFYIEDGRVYATSDNQNYTLSVEPGKLIRLPYPTLADALWMGLLLLIICLILFGLFMLYKKRKSISAVIGIIKCRIHHRHFKASEPIDEPRVSEMPKTDEKTGQTIYDGDKISISVDAPHADMLLTDPQAKGLVKKEGDVVYTDGTSRASISVGELSDAFEVGDRVDINSLKDKGLIPKDAGQIKVVGGGKIDKSLTVYANDFTLSAIKMIALSGGQAIKSVTLHGKAGKEKE